MTTNKPKKTEDLEIDNRTDEEVKNDASNLFMKFMEFLEKQENYPDDLTITVFMEALFRGIFASYKADDFATQKEILFWWNGIDREMRMFIENIDDEVALLKRTEANDEELTKLM